MTDDSDTCAETVRTPATVDISSATAEMYARLKRLFGNGSSSARSRKPRKYAGPNESVPFGPGREPSTAMAALDALTADLGWATPLSQSELVQSWPGIVGEQTAVHTRPVGISRGVLTVQCESTAWATQLRLMRTQIMNRIAEEFADAGVESISFLGPGTRSWNKGLRVVGGRGPRDTYG